MPILIQESATRPAVLVSCRRWLVSLSRSRTLLIGAGLVGLFLVLAVLGSVIAPYDPIEFHMEARFEPPSKEFLLGTDNFGRDIASRIILGSRSILLLAGSASLLGLFLGTLIGLISGYYGGLLDEIVMRVIDGLMSIPSLLMAMLVISTLGTSTINLIIAIGILYTPMVARVTRSATLQEKVREYVAAAQVRGESTLYILFREILPNITSPLVVEGSIRFCYATLLSASLGFLGLGVRPPTPDWGLMVNEGRSFMLVAPWVVISPAAAISLLVIGVNLLGDGIQEVLGVSGSKRLH